MAKVDGGLTGQRVHRVRSPWLKNATVRERRAWKGRGAVFVMGVVVIRLRTCRQELAGGCRKLCVVDKVDPCRDVANVRG
jgi:hypothetical protein